MQVGAGLAARLFSQVPPAAVTGLRLWAAALLLAVLGARGLRREITGLVRRRAWADAAVVVAFGLTLAVMNYCIYQAFARIPLGVAVTVEFLGPLAVAVAATRRALDLAWVALAAAGVALLSQAGGQRPPAVAVSCPGRGLPWPGSTWPGCCSRWPRRPRGPSTSCSARPPGGGSPGRPG